MIRKTVFTLVGGLLVALGVVFIVVPGPSLLLLIPGLYLLSFDYPIARLWLKRCQKLLAKSARWLDGVWQRHKLRRS